MNIFYNEWTRLDVPCSEFNDVAADSVIPVEFVLQAGEAIISMQSRKYVLRGQLFHMEGKTIVPYIIHLKNIEAMSLKTVDGHCELLVTHIARSDSEFKITGLDCFMSFQGQSLDVAFLRADNYGWVLEPVEGMGKCFAEMQRDAAS